MDVLSIVAGVGLGLVAVYITFGRWLGAGCFGLSGKTLTPAREVADGRDYLACSRGMAWFQHVAPIVGFGALLGPAVAVAWGWLPALVWVVVGCLGIGAVQDYGALVVGLKAGGRSVGEAAGRLVSRPAGLMLTALAVMALLLMAGVMTLLLIMLLKRHPETLFPWLLLIGFAVLIGGMTARSAEGTWAVGLAGLIGWLLILFLTGADAAPRWAETMVAWPWTAWVAMVVGVAALAAMGPSWLLVQSHNLLAGIFGVLVFGGVVAGVAVASFAGGAPPVAGAERPRLEMVAPAWNLSLPELPWLLPFFFLAAGGGAVAGYRGLVASSLTSKQLAHERDALWVGYGGGLAAGFVGMISIVACAAGIGLGLPANTPFQTRDGATVVAVLEDDPAVTLFLEVPAEGEGEARRLATRIPRHSQSAHHRGAEGIEVAEAGAFGVSFTPEGAWRYGYGDWDAVTSVPARVDLLVGVLANFPRALGMPRRQAMTAVVMLMIVLGGAVLFALLRVVRDLLQELGERALPRVDFSSCAACGHALADVVGEQCPECGFSVEQSEVIQDKKLQKARQVSAHPRSWLLHPYPAGLLAAGLLAAVLGVGGLGMTGLERLWALAIPVDLALAAMVLLVVAAHLARRERASWFVAGGMIFLALVAGMGLVLYGGGAFGRGQLLDGTVALLGLGGMGWMMLELAARFGRLRGELEPTAAPVHGAGEGNS